MRREQVYGRRAVREALRGRREVLEVWTTERALKAETWLRETERLRLQFRADLFNLFNHTNFSNPQTNQSNANFGKITSTVGSAVATTVGTTAGLVGGGPRVVQLSMRLMF